VYVLAKEGQRGMDQRVYTLEIGGRPVLCFPADRLQEAQSLLKQDWLRTDLRELKSGGKPLWDGREKLEVRNATSFEAARFEKESKSLPDQDLPIVYLVVLY
jgi:hypothetical protein